MSEPKSMRRLAVLIDAENTSSRIADRLFAEIIRIGVADTRRLYGDFSKEHLAPWREILPRHALVPHHQFAYTTGKNATDIAMVIDAMDLLHKGGADGFCLVSSDSDFTRLAVRIREEGLDVFGFGETKTPESFQKACTRFIDTTSFMEKSKPLCAGTETKSTAILPAEKVVRQSPAKPAPKEAVPVLRKAIKQRDSADGWVCLSQLGGTLRMIKPDFDTRAYGASKLLELVRQTGAFDIRKPAGSLVEIRCRVAAKRSGEASG
ncbi:Uncharacterized conserved protein, LabA/DUF88 family [Nitratireductor indicus]|nr:Uncharacterized conserved protein, LabA/DUF88 family [Nitratireductor indicus]